MHRLSTYHPAKPSGAPRLSNRDLYELIVDEALLLTSEGWSAAVSDGSPHPKVYESVAAELRDASIQFGWSAEWHERQQVWIGPPGRTPVRDTRRPAPGKPPAVLWTSSIVDGLASAWVPVIRSGALGALETADVWDVRPRRGLRVLEINRPGDWAQLLDRHPGMVAGGLLQPDWASVATQIDGVHLTVEGLLTTQGTPVEVRGRTGMLFGWDAECTAWLQWPAQSVSVSGRL